MAQAWFALAEKDGKRHFVVRAERLSDGLGSFFNKSGVSCKEFGIEETWLAGVAELNEAGFVTHNFDGEDSDLEIHLITERSNRDGVRVCGVRTGSLEWRGNSLEQRKACPGVNAGPKSRSPVNRAGTAAAPLSAWHTHRERSSVLRGAGTPLCFLGPAFTPGRCEQQRATTAIQ